MNGSAGFQKLLDAFFKQPGLPFSNVLSGDRILQMFGKHNGIFGKRGIYTSRGEKWCV
jgi:hypothetical protein